MPPPPRRVWIGVSALAAAVSVALLWYFRPRPYDTIRQAERLTVYEGLPHPMYEEEAFRRELKTAETVRLLGFPFYREPLVLKVEDVKALRETLGDGGAYASYSGEKTCGGFHPDYGVEWAIAGEVRRCLICFGCSEARIEGPGGEVSSYDLRYEGRGRERKSRLLDLLRPYRRNRPPHERFGLGPLAESGAGSGRFSETRGGRFGYYATARR